MKEYYLYIANSITQFAKPQSRYVVEVDTINKERSVFAGVVIAAGDKSFWKLGHDGVGFVNPYYTMQREGFAHFVRVPHHYLLDEEFLTTTLGKNYSIKSLAI